MSLLVLGSIAFDTIETPSDRRERIWGGSASFACAAASHFTSPIMVGIVGDDFPEAWFEALKARNIDVSSVVRAAGPSFFWSGRYLSGFTSRETLETKLGVFANFSPQIPATLRKPGIAFLGNIEPRLQRRVLEQLDPGVTVAMDTMNLWLDTVRDEVLDMIGRVGILLVNEEEAVQITGRGHALRAAEALAAMGPRTIVVKLGSNGALLLHEGEPFLCPSYPVEKVVDPTGAGDSFAGAFLGSLAAEPVRDGRAMHRALVNGSAVASWAVEHFEPRAVLEMPARELAGRFVFIRKLINY